jgi:hypothetical protein
MLMRNKYIYFEMFLVYIYYTNKNGYCTSYGRAKYVVVVYFVFKEVVFNFI